MNELKERKHRHASGTVVEVWLGLDEQSGYQTVCVPHGGILDHETRANADYWAAHADEWCPGCQEAAPEFERTAADAPEGHYS